MNACLKRHLLGLGFATLVAAPAVSFAQDADGDGVLDDADAFPCDPSRASISYFPGSGSAAMLVYEDQWPGSTDLDFNDVVARVHYRIERHANGNVTSIHALLDPDALGGILSNGLALQLTAPREGATARRRVGGGGWESLALEGDASATVVLSQNLRELFGGVEGRINSVPGQATIAGQRLEFELHFATPAPISVSQAPFDLFIFRAGDFSHQIHFPQYSGTAAMNTGLFNSDQDASTPGRRFIHLSGIPAALSLFTSMTYPLEGVAISNLFPDIIQFANSGGVSNTNFYATTVIAANGRAVGARVIANNTARDVSCIPVVTICGDGLVSGGEVCDSTETRPCTTTASNIAGMPAYCGSITMTGIERCRSDCTGWNACEAPTATMTSNSYSQCSNAAINLSDFFCCALDTCRNDTCCNGANGTNSVLGTGYVERAFLPNSQGNGNCRLGDGNSFWRIAVSHTTAAYRCWR